MKPSCFWQIVSHMSINCLECLLLIGGLLAAWQSSKSHSQRRDVISWISKQVLAIREDDAQALPDRDPERPGLYDEVCSKLTCCRDR